MAEIIEADEELIVRNKVNEVIEAIKMDMNDDINDERSYLVVEGDNDIEWARNLLDKEVAIYQSGHGKDGIARILSNSDLTTKRLIAIRDRDYSDVTEYEERLFAYDGSCLEVMLIHGTNTKSRFHQFFYKGIYDEAEYVKNAMRVLAPYSLLRKKNEKEDIGISFSSVAGLVKSEDTIDNFILFRKVNAASCLSECETAATVLTENDLIDITNGHDLCTFLGLFSKAGGAKLGEDGIRDILLSTYTREEFAETNLYQDLRQYEMKYNVKYVV